MLRGRSELLQQQAAALAQAGGRAGGRAGQASGAWLPAVARALPRLAVPVGPACSPHCLPAPPAQEAEAFMERALDKAGAAAAEKRAALGEGQVPRWAGGRCRAGRGAGALP